MITEKSNRLQVIMITDYDYPNSGQLSKGKALSDLQEETQNFIALYLLLLD